jgi:hypothetical protein
VLDGLTGQDVRLLDLLRVGTDQALLTSLPGGPSPERVRELLDLLAGAGLLLGTRSGRAALTALGPARSRLDPDALAWSLVHPADGDGWELLAARAGQAVEVTGAGRTGALIAATLAAAGIGDVRVRDGDAVRPGDVLPGGHRARDVGRSREASAADAVARAGEGHPSDPVDALTPGSMPAPRWRSEPDLVVLVDHGVADARRGEALLRADAAHLSVVVREVDLLVGPLVVPGRGPCLRCLDLHRTDRDDGWPRVLAQLLENDPGRPHPEETAVSTLAAGLAALQVLGFLHGRQPMASVGATLEVALPDGLVGRRAWPAHPRCGCHWPPPGGGASLPRGAEPVQRQWARE